MFLEAVWDAPAGVRAVTTLRTGGTSQGSYESFNLATHVGDDPERVAANRRLLTRSLSLEQEPFWLDQVHGTVVVNADETPRSPAPQADGAVTSRPGLALAILTADCLPVVLAHRSGGTVAALHAGWKGLAAGVLEAGLERLGAPPSEVVAWIGPGIGAASYQVGADVRSAFLVSDPSAEAFFAPDTDHEHGPRWRFDLAAAAAHRLRRRGVGSVSVCGLDTLTDFPRFFSHRRQSTAAPGTACGRQATLVWISPSRSPHE